MRISSLFCILLCCCIYQTSRAQGENMNWHYGRNVSLNFGQTPLTLGNSEVNVLEGCSSVSDANGNLLFYTSGFKIWDKNGVEMPNATGLQGNGPLVPGLPLPSGSGYKSVYIIRHPGNNQQYFVVSGDPYELTVRKLYYHVVDMSLNNGFGDVIPGQKNIEIMTGVSENLSVLSGADCNTYWLVAPKEEQSNQYYTFKIDAAGFHNTPVINTLPVANIAGFNKELFQTKNLHTVVGLSSTHLFSLDFDGVNGTLSNFNTIATALSTSTYYNASPGISKDKTKFYFGNSMVSNLYQVDLNLLPNLTAVLNSKVEVIPPHLGPGSLIFYLRTAPVEDKIYLIQRIGINNNNIASLSNASQAGAQVVYNPNALPLFPGNIINNGIYFSLGTDVLINPPSDSVFNSASDTVLCNEASYQLNVAHANASQYEWSTGATTAAITVTQSGTYWVKSRNACEITFDTFRVNFLNPEVILPADTSLCIGKSLVIEPVSGNAESYLWNTGATTPALTVTAAGTYYLEIMQQGCKATDTIYIEALSAYVDILQKDTVICNNMPINIKAVSNLESTYSWNEGTTGPSLTPNASGQYIVTAVNRCGSFTDAVTVEVIDCVCSVKVPDVFTPNGDGLNDVLAPVVAAGCNAQSFNFRVYNRFGQLVFTGIRPGQGWDGYFKGRPAETGVYMYYLDYKDIYSGNPVQLKGDVTLMR